ncbi:MAG TPA: class I SAM-dependent methyltransferase, partial [Longimicrobiaceae bacterium]|nr:class I SAM-dependent methyltransferase [Longimicrobiaceae bacterium]
PLTDPHGTQEARSAAFYDRTAPVYDQAMDAPVARELRECFWQRAEAEFPAGARLFDFGAGSGLDAEHFAARGYHVTAYEPSAGMAGLLRERCAAQAAAGRVVALGGSFAELEAALARAEPFDGVVCNFAVFSLLPRLEPVFRLFGRIVKPGGRVLVTIQNPWYTADMRRPGFWKALLRFPAARAMRYSSADTGFTTHWLPSQIRRAARPEFRPVAQRMPPAGECARKFGTFRVFRLLTFERA